MANLLGQIAKPFHALEAVADAFSGTVYSSAWKMNFYQRASALIHKAVGALGTSLVTVEACTASNGTGATAIPFKYQKNTDTTASDDMGAHTSVDATGFTTTVGSHHLYQLEIDAKDIPEGHNWLRIKCVEVANDPVLGGIIVLLHEGKEQGATLPRCT